MRSANRRLAAALLRAGDALELSREPDNPHDANGVRARCEVRVE